MTIKELLLTAKSMTSRKQVSKFQESPWWLKSNFHRSIVNLERKLEPNKLDDLDSIPPYDDPLY